MSINIIFKNIDDLINLIEECNNFFVWLYTVDIKQLVYLIS